MKPEKEVFELNGLMFKLDLKLIVAFLFFLVSIVTLPFSSVAVGDNSDSLQRYELEREERRLKPKIILISTKAAAESSWITSQDGPSQKFFSNHLNQIIRESGDDIEVVEIGLENLSDLKESLRKERSLLGEDHGPILGVGLLGHGSKTAFAINKREILNGKEVGQILIEALSEYNRSSNLGIYVSACLCGSPLSFFKKNFQKSLLETLVSWNKKNKFWRDFMVIAHPFTTEMFHSPTGPWMAPISVIFHRTGLAYIHNTLYGLSLNMITGVGSVVSLVFYTFLMNFFIERIDPEFTALGLILGPLINVLFGKLHSDLVYIRSSSGEKTHFYRVSNISSATVNITELSGDQPIRVQSVGRCEIGFTFLDF